MLANLSGLSQANEVMKTRLGMVIVASSLVVAVLPLMCSPQRRERTPAHSTQSDSAGGYEKAAPINPGDHEVATVAMWLARAGQRMPTAPERAVGACQPLGTWRDCTRNSAWRAPANVLARARYSTVLYVVKRTNFPCGTVARRSASLLFLYPKEF